MMKQKLEEICQQAGRFWTQRSISQKTMSRLCVAVVICMLVPLVVIALFNYPADDDFGFVLPSAQAWVETGSVLKTLEAMVQKTYDIYVTWQGDFVSTFFFGLTPMVFNIDLYFISNWILLAALCLSVGYLVKTMVCRVLQAGNSVFWIVYAAALLLVLQFLPSMGEGIFWHNGGMYTVAACTLFCLLGLLVRCELSQTRPQAIWRGLLAVLCGFMLGGSFYGPALGAITVLLLMLGCSLVQKRKNRVQVALAVAGFLVAFVISLVAPGNALRQERMGEAMGPLTAVITAVLDSFDLMGQWLSPQLLGMALLIAPVLWQPLRNSRLQFRHPFWFAVMLYGMFSATLVPGIYTGSSYTMGRYYNVVYLFFLVLALGSMGYLEGWLIRRLEGKRECALAEAMLARTFGQRFTALSLAIAIALTAVGGFEFTIMNTASISATKSLITGESAQFHRDMKEREQYILVTDSDVVQVAPLGSQPYVFKPDKLPFQGIYGRVRYMKWYFECFETIRGQDGSQIE